MDGGHGRPGAGEQHFGAKKQKKWWPALRSSGQVCSLCQPARELYPCASCQENPFNPLVKYLR